MRSAISTEEESEVTRHLASPEVSRTKEDAKVARSRSAGKRMSLAEVPAKKQRAPLRTAMSVQVSERLWSQAKVRCWLGGWEGSDREEGVSENEHEVLVLPNELNLKKGYFT